MLNIDELLCLLLIKYENDLLCSIFRQIKQTISVFGKVQNLRIPHQGNRYLLGAKFG